MFKARFTKTDIEKYIKQQAKRQERVIINTLQYVGENFVINARNNGQYRDVTGNLRSSIGYVILNNGSKVHQSDFEPVRRGNSSGIGIRRGKTIIQQLISEYRKGIVLVVVAGMEYAALVEARGKDVITGSSMIAREDLRAAMKTIK